MGIEEFNDRLIYCNPYSNPFGWYKHFWGDYTPSELDSPFVKFYEKNKKNYNDNDDFKKVFPTLDLTYKAGRKTAEKISPNLTVEERKEYIRGHGGGLRYPEKEVENDNTALKVTGGVGILAGLAIAADCIFAKGKHVKQLTKCFKGKSVSKVKTLQPKTLKPKAGQVKPNENTLPKSSNVRAVASKTVKFNTIEEAQTHFRSLGIEADLSKATDLTHIEHVAKSLEQIKNMGIKSQVKSITYTSFEERAITDALRKRGLTRGALPEGDISWAYGASEQGHIFLNPRGAKYMSNGSDVIKHEIGHYHRCVLKDNFYGTAETANEVYVNTIRNIARKTNMSEQQVMQKLTSKLHSEVKAYSPAADESFADMFSLMIDGKQYSKGAMLFYDMAGGGRIPNKVINGMKYDDYMADLYLDAEKILTNYIK